VRAGLAGSGCSTLCCRLEFSWPGRRGWHLSGSTHPGGRLPIPSQGQSVGTQRERRVGENRAGPPSGHGAGCFCSGSMQWSRLPRSGDLGAEGPQLGPAEQGGGTRAELAGGPDSAPTPRVAARSPLARRV